MANQTVVSAAAIWQALFDTLTGNTNQMDFTQSGSCFFVDGNAGLDTNDGLSWDTAFVTLNRAIRASNADIAARPKGWASRNKIYVKGDAIDEDLTVAPSKVDIIGVGSCDAQPMARLLGTQAFTSAGAVRFFNFEFWNDSADANFTFTTCDGIEFHNCKFSAYGTGATPATHALRWVGATGSDVVIENCIFRPMNTGSKYSTAAISLEQTTLNGCVIRNNIIDGTIGINIDSTNVRQTYIDNNLIVATTFPIDDESDLVIVTKNRMITAGDGTTLETVLDTNLALSAGNVLTSSNGCVEVPEFTTYA